MELQLLARLRRRERAELEPVILGGHLEIEVVRHHEYVDGQLQFHPPGAEAHVRAQPIRRVTLTAMLVARRQVAVDVEREGVGEDVVHEMRGCLGNVDT